MPCEYCEHCNQSAIEVERVKQEIRLRIVYFADTHKQFTASTLLSFLQKKDAPTWVSVRFVRSLCHEVLPGLGFRSQSIREEGRVKRGWKRQSTVQKRTAPAIDEE